MAERFSLRDNPTDEHSQDVQRAGYNGSTIDLPTLFTGNPQIGLLGRYDARSPQAQIYQYYRDSVAHITANDGIGANGSQTMTDGTGFFVRTNGLLATDFHVVKDAKGVINVTTADGRVHQARIVDVDPSHDLALLQVAPVSQGERFHAVNLAPLTRQDTLTTLGYPKNSDILHVSSSNYTEVQPLGKYSVAGGLYPGESPSQRVYANRMNVARGNSGGPLFDSQGNVVGVIDLTNESDLAVSTPVQPLIDLVNKNVRGYVAPPQNYYQQDRQNAPYQTAFQSGATTPGYYNIPPEYRDIMRGQTYGNYTGDYTQYGQTQQYQQQTSAPFFAWRPIPPRN